MSTAQPVQATVKRLRLEDVVKAGQPVYVRNRTSPKGAIILRIADPTSGKSYPLTIPKTFIPIEVSAQIPGDVLVRSIDFKQVLNGKSAILVDAEEAELELAMPRAIEEYKRLFTTVFSDLANDNPKIYETLQKVEEGKSAAALNNFNESIETEVSPVVLGVCSRFNSKELTASQVVNEFLCVEEDIKIPDCDHIVANCTGEARTWGLEKRQQLLSLEE